MSEKLKLHWVRKDIDNPVANVLGYATHNNMMKKYSERYFDYDENAKIALTITPADHFVPIPGKFNILFTMWEALNVPDTYIKSLNNADLILVPSRFCRDIFKPLTTKPVEVCWEGIEPDKFPFKEREFPYVTTKAGLIPKKDDGKRFRILWLGAPNPRKGYHSMMELIKVFENIPEFEIYLKTTAFAKSTLKQFIIINWRRILKIIREHKKKEVVIGEITSMRQSIKRFFKPNLADQVQVMGKHKNIFFDTRKLPFDELVQLYHSAHVFLSPHCGEGWNLPLCEAMATGCPCIATGASGCMDFFDEETGYPIKYELKESELQNYNLKAKVFVPDTNDLLERTFEVFRNYPAALRKGKRASDRIHDKFTWEHSAYRLNELINKYYKAGANG